jgi:hypothetical protein
VPGEDLLLMAWADLYDYILSLAPVLRETAVGVPEEHIVTCERNWALELPRAYRDFLACMGVDAGRFSPLAGKEWNFYELLREPPEDYRPQKFFRIGVDVDTDIITWSELYLDMATVQPDGDCDVVEVEWMTDPASSTLLTPRQTFLERILDVSWMAFGRARFAHNRLVFADRTALASVHEVLNRLDFNLALPPQGGARVWSKHDGVPATAHASDGSILSVVVAADDEAFVRRVTQLLLDNVPGAHVNPRFPSLQNS